MINCILQGCAHIKSTIGNVSLKIKKSPGQNSVERAFVCEIIYKAVQHYKFAAPGFLLDKWDVHFSYGKVSTHNTTLKCVLKTIVHKFLF